MANGGGDDRCDERELGSFSASDLSGVMETVRLMDGLEGYRQVEVVNMSKPKRRGNASVTKKQLRQTKLTPGKFVGALTGFHAIKSKIHSWFEDRKWLEQDWRKVSLNVSLYTEETNTLATSTSACKHLVNRWENCDVLSALMWAVGWPSTPRRSLADINFILHPVDLDANHGGIIFIRLQTTPRALLVHVHMYEPLIGESYHDEMHKVWEG
ncbi:hypothetical protein JG687_00018809 [Phytophthora cactorum]|uniref:Uncharacterized protein n=1 Tax=Phytophthora cactorum TaxID=29920 RepID=A0A8T1TLV4_9STRA|nr:hypothetical protein JG687_00018809 [Phytophthora cactorum]